MKAPTFAGLAPGACFYWHRGGPLCVKLGPARWSPVGGLQHRLRDVRRRVLPAVDGALASGGGSC